MIWAYLALALEAVVVAAGIAYFEGLDRGRREAEDLYNRGPWRLR